MSSPSPPGSTASLLARQHQSLLTRLVSHFINAKQSLASTERVYRAREIVTTARASIETIAVTAAGNSYLLTCAQRQIQIAERARQAIERIRDQGEQEFKSVLLNLDAADARTKKTLELLRTTKIDPCFRGLNEEIKAEASVSTASIQNQATGSTTKQPPESLYDFVSERGVEQLTRFFRDRIDEVNGAGAEFSDAIKDFDDRLQEAKQALAVGGISIGNARLSNSRTVSAFRALEAHAEDAAESLQSLVRHYDRCVDALKNTEGGAEAAAMSDVASASTEATEMKDGPGEAKPLGAGTSNRLSEAERMEMLQILEQDALEVNEVVSEINDHLREMELHADQIEDHVSMLKRENSGLVKCVQCLDNLGHRMSTYIHAGSEYLEVWAEQRIQIEDKMTELEAAHEFYQRFLRAYDGTVLEIRRRMHTKGRIESVMADAIAKLDTLYQEDMAKRQAYLDEHSDYIPSDLWKGVGDEPPKFDIVRVDQATGSLPEVSNEAVQAAILRLKDVT